MEALRVLAKYGNPDVSVLTNLLSIFPISLIAGGFPLDVYIVSVHL
jgi:hypothetical protein